MDTNLNLLLTDIDNNGYEILIQPIVASEEKSCTFFINNDEETLYHGQQITQLVILCENYSFEDKVALYNFFNKIKDLQLYSVKIKNNEILLFDNVLINYQILNVFMYDYLDENIRGNTPASGFKYVFQLIPKED